MELSSVSHYTFLAAYKPVVARAAFVHSYPAECGFCAVRYNQARSRNRSPLCSQRSPSWPMTLWAGLSSPTSSARGQTPLLWKLPQYYCFRFCCCCGEHHHIQWGNWGIVFLLRWANGLVGNGLQTRARSALTGSGYPPTRERKYHFTFGVTVGYTHSGNPFKCPRWVYSAQLLHWRPRTLYLPRFDRMTEAI